MELRKQIIMRLSDREVCDREREMSKLFRHERDVLLVSTHAPELNHVDVTTLGLVTKTNPRYDRG
jgi:hypothetical protein